MESTMKRSLQLITLASLVFVGCQKKTGGAWDDDNTTGRYMYKNVRSVWGTDNDGQLAQNMEDFSGPEEDSFIPLEDEDLKGGSSEIAVAQPKFSPGEAGSGLPGIDHFRNPMGELASVFRTVYFNTDDYVLRGEEYQQVVENVAKYLKAHPDTYVYVTGNCDERAAEAYNLALGSRRANYVRSLLVKQGVDLNQIHTVSYGKEKPAVLGHNSEAWAKNRRAEFKIYRKE